MTQTLVESTTDRIAPLIVPMPCIEDAGVRFAFPEVDEPKASCNGDDGPRLAWPESERPQTAHAVAELAQSIRWRLPGDRPSVLAVTSPNDADGKTSLVIELARELAQRTPGGLLVVDADARGRGLIARLAEANVTTTAPPETLSDNRGLVWPTTVPGLSVLSTSATPQPDCPWHNDAWIASLRERWQLTLFDCASLEQSETAQTLGHCDGVFVVVRLGHTSRRAVVAASQIIPACGGRLLGCIAVA
ncbi:MAG: hypothetical protein ABFC63_01890 [Thermoguttaceae bacterium]